jgi:LmbE family N-acetylglucosaminyl deacetylase
VKLVKWVCIVALTLWAAPAVYQQTGQQDDIRVLLVNAHPDDDAAVAGAMYQVTHQLGGVVDLAVVTDGSGGFRYSTLAEPIYGLDLTDETVARAHLPAIRKQEVMAGGAIVGIRDYFFLDEYDHEFTLNTDTVLGAVWDSTFVRRRLTQILERGTYDFVIGLLPFEQSHGHHKAATILAIDAALSLAPETRPIVLGGFPCQLPGAPPMAFEGLPEFPQTGVTGGSPLTSFDLLQKFGFNDRLDFRIVSNWVIAEHKSQGTMSMLMNTGERECYWYFDANGPAGRQRTVELFEALALPPNPSSPTRPPPPALP